MSEIYGLGIAMPMNYKAMVKKLDRFGDVWTQFEVIVKCPRINFQVSLLSNGKTEVSGMGPYGDTGCMTDEELETAMMWAATALIGTLSTRGVAVVGMEEIEKGSHIEGKSNKVKPPVVCPFNT